MGREQNCPGVPLAHYRQHGAGVELTCRGCQRRRIFSLEAVIRRLEARGVGGARTGIRFVARLVREACPGCGGSHFESRPAFAPLAKDQGWRSPPEPG